MDKNRQITARVVKKKRTDDTILYITRKEPAQVQVSTAIFHDGVRRKTCSDTRITLAQYPIIMAVHSVHFANPLRVFTLRNDSKCLN